MPVAVTSTFGERPPIVHVFALLCVQPAGTTYPAALPLTVSPASVCDTGSTTAPVTTGNVTIVNVAGVIELPLASVAVIVMVYSVFAASPVGSSNSPVTRTCAFVSSPSNGW